MVMVLEKASPEAVGGEAVALVGLGPHAEEPGLELYVWPWIGQWEASRN